jgi:hypothetical protein
MKYNVKLEFTRYVDDIEAESEEDAIKQALIQVTNDPSDFFTAEDEIANKIQDNFFDCSYASLVEENEYI